jgi:hypothetical protein
LVYFKSGLVIGCYLKLANYGGIKMGNKLDMTWSALKKYGVEGGTEFKDVLGFLDAHNIKTPRGNVKVKKLDDAKLSVMLNSYGYEPMSRYKKIDLAVYAMVEFYEYVRTRLTKEGIISSVLDLKLITYQVNSLGAVIEVEFTPAVIVDILNGRCGDSVATKVLNSLVGFKVDLKELKGLGVSDYLVVTFPEGFNLSVYKQGNLLDNYIDSPYWIDDYLEIRGQQLVDYILGYLQN